MTVLRHKGINNCITQS